MTIILKKRNGDQKFIYEISNMEFTKDKELAYNYPDNTKIIKLDDVTEIKVIL